jgi:hypothetical protein
VKPGPLDMVEVVKSKELWSEYSLKDGSTLRVKPTIIEARRARGQFTVEGDPVYIVKTGLLISTVAPARLKRLLRRSRR